VVSATANDVVDVFTFLRGRMLADHAPTPRCNSKASPAQHAASLSARAGRRPATTSAMPMVADDDGGVGAGRTTRGRAA
jgi:hypothetical protein